MGNAEWFRDSTQIKLSTDGLGELQEDLEERFVVTIVSEESSIKIVGSPVVISEVERWLLSRGVIDDY
ncbi:VNG_1110C family protein [Halogranum amylolyticum]|uniref:VNG_1110C family protein n=1 Tax=Halogranum amylolyticum TaxID=660520 RepID=UPI000A4F1977|nr:hypothetical protein [Halogranum amylolyticum]